MSFDRAALGPGFQLGVATSSYQIEGAVAEDGRGPSIWDDFTHSPGKIKDQSTGDEACDHYRRFREDVALMDWLGVDAYRFSIAWPRVLPAGRGAVNEKGLDFYERLVDALLERGISPCATLYHWDLPSALEAEGGWLSRSTAHAFAEYSALVARRLGDRVALWLTHNEPWCQAFLGYQTALFAPGKRDMSQALTCAHHLLVSHGLAVQALRSHVRTPVGIAPNFMPAHPASDAPEDVAAARRQDGYFNRWFIEPVLGLGYPADMLELYGALMPSVPAGDAQLIAQPIDVVGVNYYERCIVGHQDDGSLFRTRRVRTSERPRTADREIYAPGLREVLDRLHVSYRVPRIVVTENGAASRADEAVDGGRVHDRVRVDFLREHLEQVAEARRAGVPVDGYFAWSLMDNFEWSEGYTLRYGVVHVDFATQKRTPKDSALFLRSLSQRAPR
ncbi:MAG TPA: GH1 family beta-glucosidase [Polyangiaceae bacterium]|jgi:beta-glucosidase|nr:GH1 family beta-glucosidase [Polyangiaceae bacterium]